MLLSNGDLAHAKGSKDRALLTPTKDAYNDSRPNMLLPDDLDRGWMCHSRR